MTDDSGQKKVAAPYIAFSTLRTFIAPLKEHIVPTRIDRSLLKSMSGAVQNQLMTALRFLALIDAEDRPTASLKGLVAASGTDDWKPTLGHVLRDAYPDLFKLPLGSISPQEFYEAFKRAYPCEGDTLRKGVTFFLNAAREAGISLSPFLTKNAKPRSGPTRRKSKTNGKKADPANPANPANPSVENGDKNSHNKTPTSMGERLLEKFPPFDPAWPDEIKAKWFEGYEKLLNMK